MHNGCICCTLRGDLLKTVKQLALDDANYDYLVIESTGISEPLPVAQTFVLDANEDEDEHGDEDEDDADDKVNQNALKTINGNKKKSSSKQQKLSPRERLIKKLCSEIGCTNPKTEVAAAIYAKEMEQLDDEMEDIANTQTLLDCVVVASRFYEEELIDLEGLDSGSFKDFDIDTFRDNEGAIFSIMDYCLYIRS